MVICSCLQPLFHLILLGKLIECKMAIVFAFEPPYPRDNLVVNRESETWTPGAADMAAQVR